MLIVEKVVESSCISSNRVRRVRQRRQMAVDSDIGQDREILIEEYIHLETRGIVSY